jgi:hypothetical protein
MRRGRLRNTKANIFCLHLLSPGLCVLPPVCMDNFCKWGRPELGSLHFLGLLHVGGAV